MSNSPEHESSSEPLTARPGDAEPPTTSAAATWTGRLVPGVLRQMVIDHLQAHPDEAFTATRLSRIIESSSGAIANVLTKLTATGIAEEATSCPRTYRLARPTPAVASDDR
ncbi:hypothetical protein ACIQU6_33745 [Streptomyces sp. NPDC090442]|uniref:hypothetical protein n=1 Tax=Streptomyces sp. NPDC090442 TaxID=3365962 RepID=UPI00382572CE